MEKINKVLLAILLVGMITFVALINYGVVIQKTEADYNPKTVVVNSLLKPYVNEYVVRLKAEGIDLPFGEDLVLIDFTQSLPNKYLGIAWGMEIDNITLVQINIKTWYYLTDQQRRLTIWHELTHDIFDKYHGSSCVMNTPMPNKKIVTRDFVDRCIEDLVKQLKNNQDDTN